MHRQNNSEFCFQSYARCFLSMTVKVASKKPVSTRKLWMNTWKRRKEMKTKDECGKSDSFSDPSNADVSV